MPKDRQQQNVYTLDAIFWTGTLPKELGWTDPISFEDWAAFADTVFKDGLQRPYRNQIRRAGLCHSEPMVSRSEVAGRATAYIGADKIEIADDRLKKWVALHEVAHLLAPCHGEPHYWRWLSVYTGIIGRWVGLQQAREFESLGRCAFALQFNNPRCTVAA